MVGEVGIAESVKLGRRRSAVRVVEQGDSFPFRSKKEARSGDQGAMKEVKGTASLTKLTRRRKEAWAKELTLSPVIFDPGPDSEAIFLPTQPLRARKRARPRSSSVKVQASPKEETPATPARAPYAPVPPIQASATPAHLASAPSAPAPPISAPGLLAGITPLTPRPDPSAAARIRRILYDGDGGKEAGSGGGKEVEDGRSGGQGRSMDAKETSAVIASDVEVLLAASCSSLQAVAGLSPGRVSFWSRQPAAPWELLATLPLPSQLAGARPLLLLLQGVLQVKVFIPSGRTVRETSLGVDIEDRVTSSSSALLLTEKEEVSKVYSCKVAPSLACVFWVVGEESRGVVVEWGEREVVRHLATLQGEVCSLMSIGGSSGQVAALLADSRLVIWSWKTGARTLLLPLKMLPEPETIIRIHQDPAGAIFFCDLAEGDLRMSYLRAEGEFSFLREFLRLPLPSTVTELHTPKVTVSGSRLLLLHKASISEWDLASPASSPTVSAATLDTAQLFGGQQN